MQNPFIYTAYYSSKSIRGEILRKPKSSIPTLANDGKYVFRMNFLKGAFVQIKFPTYIRYTLCVEDEVI